jgi:hypothetical protein
MEKAMSDKDRQKKEGRDTNKKNQQMREDEVERHKDAVPRAPESNSKGEDRGQQEKRRHPQS